MYAERQRQIEKQTEAREKENKLCHVRMNWRGPQLGVADLL